ncbi:hypothetical protein [Brachybacterium sacelli]|uniref:DoxX family protein n=1 Tax=Brachybacterium sacelli TaxID=173364 RepID=A0ABS4WZM8_9MICO|nr:hypothetical protein [Brachybacterium sacelli]MBP2381665.1 hypothetical protein [Brachybacterium sacelli]
MTGSEVLPDAEADSPDTDAPHTDAPDADADSYATEKRIGRLVAVTLGWWAHGGVRLALALVLMYYGAAKLVLGQFGVADPGDALITQGEMSPMGLLWRMVAFSPLFQFLGGLAEFGAGLALLWRRTVPLGAAIGAASMSLVLVLNIGYDVMVKTPSLIYIILSLIVLIPWMPRLARAFLGHGEIGRGPVPTLIPWRPLARVTNILGPIAAAALAVLVLWGVSQMYPPRSTDESLPAGVWAVAEDTAEPAAQLSEDTRWSAIAFGDTLSGETSQVQLRRADGELVTGTYQRTGEGTVELELHPLREEGQPVGEYLEQDTRSLSLALEERPDGTLHVTGEGQDLVLAPDESGSTLFDRGFSWGIRPDDPFNR